jgi:hypothetical protein
MKIYKSFHLALTFAGLGTVLSYGQETAPPTEGAGLPKFEAFHSNLGQQGIVELAEPDEGSGKKGWGSKKRRWGDRFSPLGSLRGSPVGVPGSRLADRWVGPPQEKAEPEAGSSPVQISVFAGTRLYHTSNVLRTKSNEIKSGVWENSVGASMTTDPVKVGSYFSMIPRLDLIMQWSNYGEEMVSDLLDYRFGMIKGGLGIPLPGDWMLTPGLEFDVLHSQASGDKIFDAVAPSLQLQKVIGIEEDTFLMFDGMLKLSNTDRMLDSNFSMPGVFADDGDNFQTTLNLSLVKTFGENGQYIFMPSLGITRSEYLKNLQDGRVDLVFSAGLSGIWQAKEWLSLQAFANYSKLSTNGKGEELLLESSSFKALDVGVSATVNHAF